jgi:hypothetical protein
MFKRWIKSPTVILITIGLMVSLLFLFSPKPEVTQGEISLKKVKGLQDCLMVALETSEGNKIYIIRCPNSDVSTHWVKNGEKFFVHTFSEP